MYENKGFPAGIYKIEIKIVLYKILA